MIFQGTEGADVIAGTSEDDTINGLDGDDTLRGEAGSDTISGGGGNDTLSGGFGADTLNGGAGIDTVKFYWEDYFRTEYEDGRVVWKIVPYAHSSYSVHSQFATLQYFSNLDILDPSAGYINEPDRILNVEAVYTGMTDDGLSGGSGAELLSGGGGNDRIFGYGGSDTLLGGDGDDTLDGGGAMDHLDGGDGFDIAHYRTTSVRILGDLRTDTVSFPGRNWKPEDLISIEGILAGTNDDTLLGNKQANALNGWDGDDTLLGGKGDDTLDGGYGSDVMAGGKGSDTASYVDVWQNVRIRLGAQLGETYGDDGSLLERDRLSSIENATGGIGYDTLLGNSGSNTLDGRGGDDRIYAREGDDRIHLSTGDDTIDGGTGVDTLVIDQKDDIIVRSGFYHDTYADGTSVDFIVLDDDRWGAGPSMLVDLITGIAFQGDGSWGISEVTNIENVEIIGAVGDDTILGSEADNVIAVGSGRNYVSAFGGDDVIYGGAWQPEIYAFGEIEIQDDARYSRELLHGGAGDDTIYGAGKLIGGSGDDRLIATNYGEDVMMRGGGGADEFVFSGLDSRGEGGEEATGSFMGGKISDFDRKEDDLIVFAGILEPGAEPKWVSETKRFEQNEYGYYRDGGDTIIHYEVGQTKIYDGGYSGPSVRLVGYDDTIAEADIMLA